MFPVKTLIVTAEALVAAPLYISTAFKKICNDTASECVCKTPPAV